MPSVSASGGWSSSALRWADMPIIDGKDVSPDEALLLGRCPECGQPLIPKTARAHASDHFFGRDPNDPWLSEEARRRYKLVIDFAAARYDPFAFQQKREEADPEGNGMSNTSSDKPVKTFLDYVALGLILEAASAFWRGEGWSRVGAGLVGGGAVLAAHYKWDWLKEKLGDRFTTTARSVATDFRWWLVPLFLLFIYVGSPTLISEVGKAITTTPPVETKSPMSQTITPGAFGDSRDPTSKEANVIRDLATKGAFNVNVYCLTTDRDSCDLAKKWMSILDTAGWLTGHLNRTDFGKPHSGLIVCVPPNSYGGSASILAEDEFELALRENSIPVSDQCPDPAGLTKEPGFSFAFLIGDP
jgi:hypothetical protein